jgi:hypothetical protein
VERFALLATTEKNAKKISEPVGSLFPTLFSGFFQASHQEAMGIIY